MTAGEKQPPEIDAPGLEALARRLSDGRGFDLLAYKPRLLRRRILSRLRVRDCPDMAAYLRLLRAEPDEELNLLRTLTIHVSGFFRNEETFEFLRERVFPGLFRASREEGRELALVSAGCAEGEEPYSLAMLLRRHFSRELESVRVRIVGLDVAEDVLDRARIGVYDADRVSDLPPAYGRFFSPEGSSVRIDESLRRMVEFERCDLKQGLPVSGADLAMCRNVLIYFKREGQKQILNGLRESLRPGGVLALGKTESLLGDMKTGFRVLDLTEHVYCKAGEEPCGWR